MIRLECSQCSADLSVEKKYAGHPAKCVHCGAVNAVPEMKRSRIAGLPNLAVVGVSSMCATASQRTAALVPKRRTVLRVAAVVALLFWGMFIWPTPFRYETITVRSSSSRTHPSSYRGSSSDSESHELLYRVNRFTGQASLVIGVDGPVEAAWFSR